MEENNTVQSYHEGACVYRGDGSLDYILHPEGVVRATGQELSHEYFLNDHLGSTHVVFDSNGAVLQATDYYAFGLEHTPKAKENENRYLYNGKELQDEPFAGGVRLGWYDYGARFYDPQLGRFTTVDPHAENYYSWSPYHYAANNPLIIIDPNGRDWYTSIDGSAIMWRKGSEDIEGYKNIGANYTQNIDDHTTVTYTQNEATSMTFTGIEESNFVAQGTGTGCKIASDQMLANEGVNSNGERINIVNADVNGVATTANANATKGINAVDNALENGNPIEVGVDYKPIQINNLAPPKGKGDGMTDHFIVVSSKTETLNNGQVTSKTYNFFDPRNSQFGTSPANTLKINNNKLTGAFLLGTTKEIPYTVTTVRRSR